MNAVVEFVMRLPVLMAGPAQQAKQTDTSAFAQLDLKGATVKKVRGYLTAVSDYIWHWLCSRISLSGPVLISRSIKRQLCTSALAQPPSYCGCVAH